jgi:uncharacterized protein (TIGR00251 family)
MIIEKEGFLLVDIKVIPKSSVNKIEIKEDQIRLKVTAPPVAGEANAAVIDFLSKKLSVPKKDISIQRGQNSRVKMICIKGLKKEAFYAAV